MSIRDNYTEIKNELNGKNVNLLVVSKYHTPEEIMEVYNLGQREFAENKVQDMLKKQEILPNDIKWHLIGHLQTNKVKYIIGKTVLIHSLDSVKLAHEINKHSEKEGIVTHCLVQFNSTGIEDRFGVPFDDADAFLDEMQQFKNIKIDGFMGMAPITDHPETYFKKLKEVFDKYKHRFDNPILSMGMSSDYKQAIENGSTTVRLGSIIFK